MNKLVTILLLLFSTSVISSQPPIKLTGTIVVSIKLGTLDAKFQLSNIPKLHDYLIHLNSGLNIEYFRNTKNNFNYRYQKQYNPTYSEESFGYFLVNEQTKRPLPTQIQFKYTGKFPVISTLTKASEYGDWKGNIAFNGKTLRTDGFQAAWYPIIYDIKQDKRYDEVAYDIEIICSDCRSIYVNGSKPVAASRAEFSREKPTSMILFAGNYDIGQHNGSYYLNSKLSSQQMSQLSQLTSSFAQFYQDKLSIPYGEDIVYIHTSPVSKNDSWFFVAYPAIVAMNHNKGGLDNLVNKDKDNTYLTFIAHELAHYYFGTYRKFNSELGDMFTESLAEYLALKSSQTLINPSRYQTMLNNMLDDLEDTQLKPFQQIETARDYGDRELYVYVYAPVIWLAIESEIGQQAMWQWLKLLLTKQAKFTNYEFLLATLSEVLQDPEKLAHLIDRYLATPDALDKASLRLRRH